MKEERKKGRKAEQSHTWTSIFFNPEYNINKQNLAALLRAKLKDSHLLTSKFITKPQ